MVRAADTAYPTGRRLARLSRGRALTVVAAWYLVAGGAAGLTALALPGHHPIATTFGADVVATVVVIAGSIAVANSSLYDPYWSVAPPVVAVAWAVQAPAGLAAGIRVRQVVVVALVAAWAVRLTGNWVLSWRGMAHEDWRYVDLRRSTAGRLPWWLVSGAGIQLTPTLVVFAGMLPLWPALARPRHGLGILDAAAFAVTAGAIGLEAAADVQLRRFAADPASAGRTMDRGTWAWSRHPNYLGEIGFWCGLWLFGVAAAPADWWTAAGPLVMIVLFEAASIPLMERRSLRRRRDYVPYQRRVPRLLPRPRLRRWRTTPKPVP